jgi:bifunctional ADP-heptose synthase (sugar kinase/adenylyltransferase)
VDTRSKIASTAEALARFQALPGPVRLVAGHFDPLLATHAARLRELHPEPGSLAVLLLDPPDPIYPARARAELLAALRSVDLVLLPEAAPLLTPPERTFESEDRLLTEALVQRVRAAS